MISIIRNERLGTITNLYKHSSYEEYLDQTGSSHRSGGWAVKYFKGPYAQDEKWYIHGKLHRVGGPAIHISERTMSYWYRNGFLHRLNAPAVVYKDGTKRYYEFGNYFSKILTIK
jgi:hypothetical protein